MTRAAYANFEIDSRGALVVHLESDSAPGYRACAPVLIGISSTGYEMAVLCSACLNRVSKE